jgi:hypothetical protein
MFNNSSMKTIYSSVKYLQAIDFVLGTHSLGEHSLGVDLCTSFGGPWQLKCFVKIIF